MIQATWTSPLTNKLLLEAGISSYMSRWGWMEPPGAILDLNQVLEQNDAERHARQPDLSRARLELQQHAEPDDWRVQASYVTGAHSMKFGYQGVHEHRQLATSTTPPG